jgi:hypothetical protein
MDGINNKIQPKMKYPTKDKNKHVYKELITGMFMTLVLRAVTSS